MKKTIFGVLILVGLNSFAQNSEDNKFENGKSYLKDRFTKELNLTSEQQKKAEEIENKYKSEEQKYIEERRKANENLKTTRDKKRKEFETILTTEQQEKLKSIDEKIKEKRKEMIQNRFNKKAEK